MKKTLLSIFTAAAMTSLYAEDFVIDQNVSGFIDFTPAKSTDSQTVDYNIYYYAAGGSTSGRLGNTNGSVQYYLNSLNFKASGTVGDKVCADPNQWDLYGTFNFDLANATGEHAILSTASKSTIKLQAGAFAIKNSDAQSTTTALIDMGDYKFNMAGGGNASTPQYPRLNIDADTRILSTHASAGLHISSKSTISVASGKTLTLDAVTYGEAGADLRSAFDLKSNAKVVANKNMTLKNVDITLASGADFAMSAGAVFKSENATITIGSGAKLHAADDMTFTNATITSNGSLYTTADSNQSNNISFVNSTLTGGTMTVSGGSVTIDDKSNVTVDSLTTGAGRSLNVAGSLSVGSNTVFHNLWVSGILQQTAGDTTTFNRATTFRTGSSFSTTGDLIIKAGNESQTHAAYVNVILEADSTSFTVKENVKMHGGTLILDKANAIKTTNGDFASLVVENEDSNMGNARLDVNANTEFNSISADTKSLEIFLSADATLTSSFSVENGAKIILKDFVDNVVYVSNYEDILNLSDVFTASDASGQAIDILYCNNGWLSTTAAVPEPAEWAAIFGAVALGLAIYRRRK